MCDEIWDDIREQVDYEAKTELKRQWELDTISMHWTDYRTIKEKAKLKDLKEIAGLGGEALQVIATIYLYNSFINIIENINYQKLLILTDAKIVIDLFDDTKDIFVPNSKELEYNSVNQCIDAILKKIDCKEYSFYSLNDALSSQKLLLKTCPSNYLIPKGQIKRGEEISLNGSMIGYQLLNKYSYCFKPWPIILNLLFHGEHNWAIGKSYYDMAVKVENKLLSFNVICYESFSDVKDEGDYYIETVLPLNNSINLFTNERFVVFVGVSSQTSETLTFLGVYNLDRAKSMEEGHLAFKKANDILNLQNLLCN